MAALLGSAQFSGSDFDSLTAPFTIATGQTVDGITFNYDFSGLQMQVSETFPTTSGQNFLGTTDADVFLGGSSARLAWPDETFGFSHNGWTRKREQFTAIRLDLTPSIPDKDLFDFGSRFQTTSTIRLCV